MRKIIAALGAAAVVLLGATAASASTTSTERPSAPAASSSVVCSVTGSVALYTDQSMSTLVDYFTFTNAPAQEVTAGATVTDDVQVDVAGDITGTAYIFHLRVIAVYVLNASGRTIETARADWRVTGPGGIVADSRDGTLRVITANGTAVVSKIFGPTEHGLFLSGGISFACPSD